MNFMALHQRQQLELQIMHHHQQQQQQQQQHNRHPLHGRLLGGGHHVTGNHGNDEVATIVGVQLQHQIQIQIQNQNQQQQQQQLYLQQLQLEIQLQQYGQQQQQQQQQQLQYQSIPLNQQPLRSPHQEQGKDPKKKKKKKSKFGYQKTLIVDPKNEDRLRKQREQSKKRKNKKTPEQIEEEAIEKSMYDKERLLNRTSEKIEQDVRYDHNTWINAPEELKERKRKTARDHKRRKRATLNAAATATATTTNDDENANDNIQSEDDVSISREVTAAGTTIVGCDRTNNSNEMMCTTAIDNNDPDNNDPDYTIPTNGVAKNNGDDDGNEQDEDKDEDDGDMSFDNNDDDDDNGNDNNDNNNEGLDMVGHKNDSIDEVVAHDGVFRSTRSRSSTSSNTHSKLNQSTANVHDITIKKDRKKLLYVANKDKDLTEISIDGKELTGGNRPSIHPITESVSGGCTPRHFATPDMVEQLDPFNIDKSDNSSPIATADAVRIKFEGTEVENYVLFANAKSTNPHLRNAYTLYTENRLPLDKMVSNLPKDVFHVDDLGGGTYVPFGIGSICQNTKRPGSIYQRWGPYQVPFTRSETHYMPNYKVFELYSKIMGEIACAIFEIFPSIYEQNQERYHGAEDCCYPTPGMQFSAKNKEKFWFAHQAIIRVIGKPFGEMVGEMLKIALHADESDAPGIQMLSFLPMGGVDDCGGHVEGTDLLVFREKSGGPCYRLNTTVRDTVVVILFNGKNQLHGGAVDRISTSESESGREHFVPACYTTRIIHYLRGPAEEYTNARARAKNSGNSRNSAPAITVRSSPPSGKPHLPICKEKLENNQELLVPWGKAGGLFKATVRKENGETKDFVFEDGQYVPNRENSNVYDLRCQSKETCECWWFPTIKKR